MLVLTLPFNFLRFLTLMGPSLVLFLVLWLMLVKDFLKVRCRLALLPFLISCLIWLNLVASLPLLTESLLVILSLLHLLRLLLGRVLVLGGEIDREGQGEEQAERRTAGRLIVEQTGQKDWLSGCLGSADRVASLDQSGEIELVGRDGERRLHPRLLDDTATTRRASR